MRWRGIRKLGRTLSHQITLSEAGEKLSRACGALGKTRRLCLGHPKACVPALPRGSGCPGTGCQRAGRPQPPRPPALLLVALSPACQRLGAGGAGAGTAAMGRPLLQRKPVLNLWPPLTDSAAERTGRTSGAESALLICSIFFSCFFLKGCIIILPSSYRELPLDGARPRGGAGRLCPGRGLGCGQRQIQRPSSETRSRGRLRSRERAGVRGRGADGRYWLPSNQREVGTRQMPSRDTRSAAHGNLKNIAVVETQNTVLGT